MISTAEDSPDKRKASDIDQGPAPGMEVRIRLNRKFPIRDTAPPYSGIFVLPAAKHAIPNRNTSVCTTMERQ
jgi:hypothetical protein